MAPRPAKPPATTLLCASGLLALLVAIAYHLFTRGSMSNAAYPIDISGKAVTSQLRKLAGFSVDPWPAVTRVLFRQEDIEARTYVKDLMKEAGLTVREDGMGNIFGRLAGSDDTAGAVMTGSHCDAIPLAGAYDGTLGVIGGIAALGALHSAEFKPQRPIDVVMFTSEEPTRFGLGCIGSRGMAGTLDESKLASIRDENGTSFQEAAASAGYPSEGPQDILGRTKLIGTGKVHSFVELHIEQAPDLENKGLQLGVVTAIAAPAALRITFSGGGGHAGALLMHRRADAALAAAELALHVEKATLAHGAEDAVGTTGKWQVSPNAVNSVPREVVLEIDVRDIDGPRRDQTIASIIAQAQAICSRRGTRHTVETINQDEPATCSQMVVEAGAAAARQLGLRWQKMVSRAYHDSLFMAKIAPTAMLFIPCFKGYSHRPDEYAAPADIERGVKALALTLAHLAGTTQDRPPAIHDSHQRAATAA